MTSWEKKLRTLKLKGWLQFLARGRTQMAGGPPHVGWLKDTGQRFQTACGKAVELWELQHSNNAKALSAWAAHFRNHYCADTDLPKLIAGTGKSAGEYLVSTKFPDSKTAPGPSVRAGDFAEILVADYIEYVLGYWCPRELRYSDRWNRNDSTKGCDVIGFKFHSKEKHVPNDELFIFEAKAGLSNGNQNRLQDAVDDSAKDILREAMTLNAIKQRLLDKQRVDDALRVQRFQNMADYPFHRINGAAAVVDDQLFKQNTISNVDAKHHPNGSNLRLIVIQGPALMDLVHALYDRAANEA